MLGVLVAAHGLFTREVQGFSSYGMQASLMALRLSNPMACGILVPRPRIEPMSPALEGRLLTTGSPGKFGNWYLTAHYVCKINSVALFCFSLLYNNLV